VNFFKKPNRKYVNHWFNASILACLLFSFLSVSVLADETEEREKERKRKNEPGFSIPNFDFGFGKKSKKETLETNDGEPQPAFPMTDRKRNKNERNRSEFAPDIYIGDENSQNKKSRSAGNAPDVFSGANDYDARRKNKSGQNGASEIYPGVYDENGKKKNRSAQNGASEIYPGVYDENGKKKNRSAQNGASEIYPGVYDENGKKKNRSAQNGASEIYPGVYDENGKKKNRSAQNGASEIYPGVYDENGKKKNRSAQNGASEIYPGVYDEDGKKKRNNRAVNPDIYSSTFEEDKKKNKDNQANVNLAPYVFDQDGKKKKRSDNNLQITPYTYEDDDSKKKDRTATNGKMEIYPGYGDGGNGTGNSDGTNNGWNGNTPFGSQGILSGTGLSGIGGFFNPSRMGVGDRWGNNGRGNTTPIPRNLKRIPPRTFRPIITMPGAPGTGDFTELEKPIIEDPYKTSNSPTASGNPGQVSNYAKQNEQSERDIHPGQSMWTGANKAKMPAYGERSGMQSSVYHMQTDTSMQPDRQPGMRGGGGENTASERGGDFGANMGFAMAGGNMTAQQMILAGSGAEGMEAAMDNRPHQNMQSGQNQGVGQSSQVADAAAEMGHDQAAQMLTHVGSYIPNFTSAGGNKWNQIRDNIFVPMGILLLLPGALATQVRAIMAQSNPVLGQANPFEGIFRGLVALFFIPASYLTMNYGIDICNSFTYTIAEGYERIFGSELYNDAMCHEIRCMPFRLPEENRNTIDLEKHSMGQILVAKEKSPFAQLEANLIAVKIWDPCDKIYIVPEDRAAEVVPVPVVGTRMVCNLANASLVTSWNILCAFQCFYLYFLWCMGPVVAGLWTWPQKQFRDSFPNWVEGVIALCFWSIFWNVTVMIIAIVRRDFETGTIIMIALNTIGNISVKFAFDFAGLIKASGDESMQFGDKLAEKAGNAGSK